MLKKFLFVFVGMILFGGILFCEMANYDPRGHPSLMGSYNGQTKVIKATSDGALWVYDLSTSTRTVILLQPTALNAYSVFVSSYESSSLVPSDPTRQYVYIQNTSQDYTLYLSTSASVDSSNSIYVFPRQTFGTNGVYSLYGKMENNAVLTSIIIGVEK